MEFDFSSLSPTAHTIATSAYIDFLPSLQYSKPLGTSRFLKTIQCTSSNGYVVVKLLVKPSDTDIDMKKYLIELEGVKNKLQNVPNTSPFETLIDSERATYLIRPYVRYNLFETLSIRPFFEGIEKKWIIYQLLTAISKMHEVGVCHGDIKLENVLLTSWNWVTIADIALFKPVYLPDYNQSQFSFYFDSKKRHSCYIAPERFKTQQEMSDLIERKVIPRLSPEADIFSLGCVIAELYSDGLPIFTLPQMFKYKKSEYSPNLDVIEDPNIKKMVESMISLVPKDRLTVSEYLLRFRDSVFPSYFYTFLYPYMKDLSTYSPNKETSDFQKCNYRIDRVYKDFDKVALYLGFKANIMDNDESVLVKRSGNVSIIPVELNLPGMNRHIPQNSHTIFKSNTTNDSSCLIILSMVCHNMRNTTHSTFRIKACDLILALAEQLHDEAKLDRCLPYLMNMLDDPSESVQVAALKSVTQLLTMVDTLTPINIHLFTEYIIPKLQLFLKRSYMIPTKDLNASKFLVQDEVSNKIPGSYVRMIFASCLPHLAMASKKFHELSVLLKDKVGTYHDPDIDSIFFNDRDKNELELNDILESFEHLTIQILTDSDVYVRISLMQNIRPLCAFFGKQKVNDVVLSHLITYLNDKNPQIKQAFVSSIVPLSIFVGITSLEQYILPLLIQSIYGPEEILVVTFLKVLSQLVELGLVRKQCYWDLINLSVVLILHPNGLIRQLVINLIVTIGHQLSTADFYCLLYPLIRPFFRHEVTELTWENLFISAHTPLTRSVYNTAKLWCLTNQETLFWQRVVNSNPSKDVDSFGNVKIRFLRDKSTKASSGSSSKTTTGDERERIDDYVPNYEIPLSNSDKKQVTKMKSLGLGNDELWKIGTMRPYIYKVTRLTRRSSNFVLQTIKPKVTPRSVFLDIKYKAKETPYNDVHGQHVQPVLQKGEQRKLSDHSGPLILKNLQLQTPVVETIEDIADYKNNYFSHGDKTNSIFRDIGDANVFDETMRLEELYAEIEFSYPGKNPFIWRFLRSLEFKPDLDDYVEFGEPTSQPEIDTNESTSSYDTLNYTLIARLNEHNAPIVSVVASTDGRFFVSADAAGCLKIWNTKRLEIDVTGSSTLSVNLGSSVKSMCIMDGRNCIAVSKGNGSVDILRVDFANNDDATPHKNTSISLLRHLKLSKEYLYATNLQFKIIPQKPYLFMLTVDGRLLAVDIRNMEIVKEFQNNILHGNVTSLLVDVNHLWAIIGTSKGIVDLIDLDECVCSKSTKFKRSSYPITQIRKLSELSHHQGDLLCFVGGTGDADVVIWDIETSKPRLVLCANNKESFTNAEQYSVVEVDDEINNDLLSMYIDRKTMEDNKSCTSVYYDPPSTAGLSGKIISALNNMKVVEWNLESINDSRIVIDSIKYFTSATNASKFHEIQVNSFLTIVHETCAKRKDSNLECDSPKMINKAPSDIITSIACLCYPSRMIVCGDRSGTINIYR